MGPEAVAYCVLVSLRFSQGVSKMQSYLFSV